MLAEVIASAFVSDLSWSASLGGTLSAARFEGQRVMIAFDRLLEDNPEMTEKPVYLPSPISGSRRAVSSRARQYEREAPDRGRRTRNFILGRATGNGK